MRETHLRQGRQTIKLGLIKVTHDLFPTEIRLLRRLVRDFKYRGTSAEKTMTQWESVRRGEYKNVFSFQEEKVPYNSILREFIGGSIYFEGE